MGRISMTRALAAGLACLALASCADEPTSPPTPTPDPLPVSATRQLWFVELETPAVSKGGALGRVVAEHVVFLGDAARLGIHVEKERRFANLWNGMSVWVKSADVPRLFGVAGVKQVFPVLELQPPAPAADPQPDLANSIDMIGADVAQSTLGFTGEGVRVAIIDTGVDWHHPDLGGCFGTDCRVGFGLDLVGDNFNAGVPGSLAIPDADPDDCNGHGTHVAGIVGAAGERTGVAPAVTFGAYRVFGCTGSTRADIMIAAMEAAYADGMRVINMSIGSSFTWPEYPTATAVTNLVEAGVVVAASIGNSGAAGLYAAGAPGVGTDTIGVASIENTFVTQPALRIDPHTTLGNGGMVGYSPATGAAATPTTGTFPLVRTGTPATTNDACDPLPADSLTGSIALVRRGACTFHVKTANVQAAGAIGAVLYNNVPGALSPTVTGAVPITIPVVAISGGDGIAVNAELDVGAPVSLTWTDEMTASPNAVAGQISGFSSWGPTANLTFKPDLAAPGGSIYSTYPLEKGGYASISGTSMASPHVAGAAALLIDARPGVTPFEIQVLLENTAVPAIHAATSVPEPTQREGAGLIKVDRAIQSPAMVTPPSLALGESTAGPATRTLTVRNLSDAAITYDVSHRVAGTVTGTTWAPVVTVTFAAAMTPSVETVTVPAGGTASLDVTITADAAAAAAVQYGGFVVLTPQGGGQALSVPYQGYVGDYQATVILAPAPMLARSSDGVAFTAITTGAFTLEGTDVPYLRIHFDHFARRLIVEVEDTAGKPIGIAFDEDFLSHGESATGRVNLRWNGTVLDKDPAEVDSGDYVLRVRVLKPLGDAANPAHWETWTSGVLTLDRS